MMHSTAIQLVAAAAIAAVRPKNMSQLLECPEIGRDGSSDKEPRISVGDWAIFGKVVEKQKSQPKPETIASEVVARA